MVSSVAQLRRGIERLNSEVLDEGAADPMAIREARRQLVFSEYRDDPGGFCREVLGDDVTVDDVLSGRADTATEPWAKQIEIMESVRDNRRTVVPSGHSVGKTHIAARVGLWFLYTRAPAVVLTTAPKLGQVRDLLWARWRAAFAQAPETLPGRCLTLRCTPNPDDPEWFALGATSRDANSISGYHEADVLLILDEGPGVPSFVWQAIEGIMSGESVRILAIGNPLRRDGAFFHATQSPLWHTIRISAYDHPNVTRQRLVYRQAVSPSWPAERLKEWGESHPLYQSRVLGREPDEAEDSVIPLSWVEASVEREMPMAPHLSAVAIDVARYGDNETVFAGFRGAVCQILHAYTGKPTTQTSGIACRLVRQGCPVLAIDDAGLGGGVTDSVQETLHADIDQGRLKLHPLNAGSVPPHPEDFADLSSEMWWTFREELRETYEARERGEERTDQGMSLPADDVLIQQLSGRHYEVDSKGRIRLESKDKIRGRGESSPDRADAAIMARWVQVPRVPGVPISLLQTTGTKTTAARYEMDTRGGKRMEMRSTVEPGRNRNRSPLVRALAEY